MTVLNAFQRHIGVGQRQINYGRHVGTDRVVPAVSESGKVVGEHTYQWDGRVNSVSRPDTVQLQGRLDKAGNPDYSTIQPREK